MNRKEKDFLLAEHLCCYGFILFERGYLKNAADAFDRALSLDNFHAESHYGRGLISLEFGEAEEAVASFTEFLCLEPQHMHGYLKLATAQWQAGRRDCAFATFGVSISCHRLA